MPKISFEYPRHSSRDSTSVSFLHSSIEQAYADMVLFRERFDNVLLKLHTCGIDVANALLEKENNKPRPSGVEVVQLSPLTIRVSERYLVMAYVQLRLFCRQHPPNTRNTGFFIIVDINGNPVPDIGINEISWRRTPYVNLNF